ncbi:hypothetical protein BH10PSE19_BH10PSE19_08770 [soil metagenome]
MIKKKTAPKKAKTPSMNAEIQSLHACIEKDQNNLVKAYDKNLAKVAKSIAGTTVALKKEKAKQKTAKSKPGKTRATTKVVDATGVAKLQQELVSLKEQHATLSSGQKKLSAQQKILQRFEKDWMKQTKTATKAKKTTKSATKKNSKTKSDAATEPSVEGWSPSW